MSDRTIAKLQRSAEKRNEHLLGVLDKNDRLRHEVEKLTRALIAIHRLADDPKVVRTIVEKNISQRLKRTRGVSR